MRVAASVRELQDALRPLRAGRTLGLVPTMGALHDGHVALVRAARRESGAVVASIFVNPAQFAPGEDLGSYPRDLERDAELAAGAGVDLLFVPPVEEMFPAGYATWVEVEGLGTVLEGSFRPGHFRGVATVCLKLFNLVAPDRAYFGQKDIQQALLVERMIQDLALPLVIRVVPTVRDADGLALSSRNVRLSPDERARAVALPRALEAGLAAHRAHLHADTAASAVLAGEGLEPEYLEVARLDGLLVLAAAVRFGATRLIDNVILEGDLP